MSCRRLRRASNRFDCGFTHSHTGPDHLVLFGTLHHGRLVDRSGIDSPFFDGQKLEPWCRGPEIFQENSRNQTLRVEAAAAELGHADARPGAIQAYILHFFCERFRTFALTEDELSIRTPRIQSFLPK